MPVFISLCLALGILVILAHPARSPALADRAAAINLSVPGGADTPLPGARTTDWRAPVIDAAPAVPRGRRYTLLLAGLDRDPVSRDPDRRSESHTDALVLLTTVIGSGHVEAYHIPRDTYITTPLGYAGRINGVWRLEGTTGLENALVRLTGLRANTAMFVDFTRFRQLMRMAGPLVMRIDRTVTSPETGVAVQPGRKTLDPEQALTVVRFRHEPLGDIGRVHRQERFLRSALLLVSRMPRALFTRAVRIADSRMTAADTRIAWTALHPLRSYAAHSVPGTFGTGTMASYWMPDHAGALLIGQSIVKKDKVLPAFAAWDGRQGLRDVDDGRDRSQ